MIATEDGNSLGCDYASMHTSDPGFKLFTVSSQTWMVEYAMRYAIALATKGTVPSSTVVPQQNYENSVTGSPNQPVCNKSLPYRDHVQWPHAHRAAGGTEGSHPQPRITALDPDAGERPAASPSPGMTGRTGRKGAMAVTAQHVQVLRLADVRKSFDGVDALKGVTFEARAGEIHALLGENGAGKSTLMAIAAGSLEPDRGADRAQRRAGHGASPLAVRQRGLSIAYQHPALVPDLTVAEDIAMWLHDTSSAPPTRQAGQAGQGADRWARSGQARVGCTAALGQRVGSLSVVQRQLLEVAKSLAAGPTVGNLFEQTAHTSPRVKAALYAELRRLAARQAWPWSTSRTGSPRCANCATRSRLRDGASAALSGRRLGTPAPRAHRRAGGDGGVPGRAPGLEPPTPCLSSTRLSSRAFHDVR